MPDEELSVHDAIEAAIDSQDEKDGTTEGGRPEEITEESVGSPEAESAPTGRDAQGRFTAAEPSPEAESEAAGEPAPAEVERTPAVAAEQAQETPAEPVIEVRAPQSWRPAAREHWAALPAEIQQEVSRREIETARVLSETADARKQAAAFREVYAPYESMIRAEGGTPERAAADLFATAAALRTAPPLHKAQLMAGMCRTFGIDVTMLDQCLSSAIAGNPQQMPQGQQPMRDPRVDQMLQAAQQTQHEGAQRAQVEADKEVGTFKQTHEFYEDVRLDMADLIEIAERREMTLSLEDAYTRAVRAHPEIGAIIVQREQAKSAAQTTQRHVKDKVAASSVSGSPAGTPPGSGPLTRRAAIEDALDQAG